MGHFGKDFLSLPSLQRALFLGKRPFLISAAGALAALVFAYGAEYGFGIKPCELCHYQRLAFGIIFFCALLPTLGDFWRPPARRRLALRILAFLFAATMALAGYQVLVEQKMVTAPKVCRARKAQTLEELRGQLEKGPPAACDHVSWSFLGVSMAGYGALFSFGFVFYLLLAAAPSPFPLKRRIPDE